MIKKNIIIEAENLDGLQYLLDQKKMRGKIDLIYIDPPFATGINFTITNGRASTISNSSDGEIAYTDKIRGDDFIEYLKKRVLLLKELLSDKGSIYLHTDYKIGHYVKVMMDEVFGIENFRNDITRVKCNPKNFSRLGYGNIKDSILFYTKSSDAIWHEPKIPYTEKDLEKLFPKTDQQGRKYTTVPIHAPGEGKSAESFKGLYPPAGRHWRRSVEVLKQWDEEGLIEWSSTGNPRKVIFLDEREGKRAQDIWEYKDPMYPVYPTEKNSDLLDLIIKTSSDQNSIVLDCFCGSGTTLKSALRHGRAFVGIDQSKLAIEATKKKLKIKELEQDIFQEENSIEIVKL